MRWRGGRESGNIEDRRGVSPGVVGGGIGAVVVVVVALLLGVDPRELLQQGGADTSVPTAGAPAGGAGTAAAPDTMRQFIATVLASTEDVWGDVFRRQGAEYRQPRLVLYTGSTPSACGLGQAAMGPFYCPGDEKVYLDLGFFQELQDRFGAAGDFAEAYVVAHEIGHHVQKLLGIEGRVQAAMARADKTEANALSVRLELQADCFAGVWGNLANRQRPLLEPGDAEEALRAASAIGDDKLQQAAQGYAVPETFTHGTSAQRIGAFKAGFESGDPARCDTFGGRS